MSNAKTPLRCIHCGTSATSRRNVTKKNTLGRKVEPINLSPRGDGKGVHDKCPHPAEVVLLAETEESVSLARRQLANIARRNAPASKDGNEAQRVKYASRPPSIDAARTETDPGILERWAIRAAKRPELWRYRSVLLANPHMTERGRRRLARLVKTDETEDPK